MNHPNGNPPGGTVSSANVAAVGDDANISKRIFAEQVRLLYDQGVAAMLAAPLCGLLIVAVLWPVTPHHRLLTWLAIVCVVTTARMYQVRAYRRNTSASNNPMLWARTYVAGSFLAGCYWGAAGPYLFPENQPQYQYILILVICLLLVSSMFSFSALKSAFFAVSIPTMLPLITILLVYGARSEQIVGVGLVLFTTVVMIYTLRIHRMQRESLALRFENIDLIDNIKSRRAQTEALNRNLMHSRSLLEATLHASAGGLASFDSDGCLKTWNQKFLDAWHLTAEQAEDISRAAFFAHMEEQLLPASYEHLRKSLRGVDEVFDPIYMELETRNHRVYDTHGEPLMLDNKVKGSVWSLYDITESRKSEERLRYMAQHDPLTGLPNRGLLYDRLEQAVLRTERSGCYSAVFYLDMDGFKKINDECGHQAGDLLLQQVAQRIKDCLRASDTVARIGGDEFVVVLEAFEAPSLVQETAKNIVGNLAKPYMLKGTERNVTVSLGIAVCPLHGTDPDQLLTYADSAMYSVKELSGNAFSPFQLTPGQ